MNCAYHGQNTAVVNCNGCGKPLCPACDHRIKGFPFCQDCIVSGVELLKNQSQTSYAPVVKRQTSPFVATLLSIFCPGLGSAYNGQTSKALIYFAVFVGFFQLAISTGGMPVFVFGFLGMWLFAAVDSWRTAQLLHSGITPERAEDVISQRFAGNPKLWGVVLTLLGASFFLQSFFNLRLLVRAILPVLLIGFGIYLLRGFFSDSRKARQNANESASEGEMNFSGSLGAVDFRAGDINAQNEFITQTRRKTWKER